MIARSGSSCSRFPDHADLNTIRHSDMGSLTLLFRQPVAALQVLGKDGTWKWVRPQTDAITVNIADALQFLTSGSPTHIWNSKGHAANPRAIQAAT